MDSRMNIPQYSKEDRVVFQSPSQTKPSTRSRHNDDPLDNQSNKTKDRSKSSNDNQKNDQQQQQPPPEEEIVITRAQVREAAKSLLEGASPESIDVMMSKRVYNYLKRYKNEVLSIPDYYQAQRIDDVCSQLMLIGNSNAYSSFQNSQIADYQRKLNQAKKGLQDTRQARKDYEINFDNYRNEAMENLLKKQQKEIEDLEIEYSGEVPPKYRKFSKDILNMRKQEFFLQKTQQYLEAQKLHEEADALEAFEYEQIKIQYINIGIEMREKLIEKHKKQIFCLNENMDRKNATEIPRFIQKEKYYMTLIDQFQRKINAEKMKASEAKSVTKSILGETINEKSSLPKLGNVVPQSPTKRVTTVNNSRRYTKSRATIQKRSKSSYH
ncbi:hypothetical protein TRFO_37684 [Tritrichomonas foetus]|uniref:Uncharacterized protein n=1 Tax=Tritrichomonas foetus TaxID=1144522 RepID=A0A1J4JG22_9EUKA|nr:hypothetical protein TRFO_37684 [Tritrichomonas foetus]|eukprot:OHS96148.1 hypothetical protein TRFO_37684 [Tritrichomonas foetus]